MSPYNVETTQLNGPPMSPYNVETTQLNGPPISPYNVETTQLNGPPMSLYPAQWTAHVTLHRRYNCSQHSSMDHPCHPTQFNGPPMSPYNEDTTVHNTAHWTIHVTLPSLMDHPCHSTQLNGPPICHPTQLNGPPMSPYNEKLTVHNTAQWTMCTNVTLQCRTTVHNNYVGYRHELERLCTIRSQSKYYTALYTMLYIWINMQYMYAIKVLLHLLGGKYKVWDESIAYLSYSAWRLCSADFIEGTRLRR